MGLPDADLGDVLHHDRAWTQALARWAYEHSYQALRYPSRFAADSGCCPAKKRLMRLAFLFEETAPARCPPC